MLVKPDCMPCYLVQCLSALRQCGANEDTQQAVLKAISRELAALSTERTPSYNSSLVIHRCYELAGISDPYAQAKRDSNQHAMKVYRRIDYDPSGDDALLLALKLAAAGNVIDLGIQHDYDIEGNLADAMQTGFAPESLDEFEQCLKPAARVLIVGDNSGEIAFDRALASALLAMGKSVVYSVKGGPVLNDATRQDAVMVEMDALVPVIDTGNAFLGVEWDACGQEFRDAYQKADLVIAKGQANYESLEGSSHAGDKTFFLLKAKCPVVADNLGVALGSWVLRRNHIKEPG